MFLILDTLESAVVDLSSYSTHLSVFSCVCRGGFVGNRWENVICRSTARAPPPTARLMYFCKMERRARRAPPIAMTACVPVWTSSARCSGDPVSDRHESNEVFLCLKVNDFKTHAFFVFSSPLRLHPRASHLLLLCK